MTIQVAITPSTLIVQKLYYNCILSCVYMLLCILILRLYSSLVLWASHVLSEELICSLFYWCSLPIHRDAFDWTCNILSNGWKITLFLYGKVFTCRGSFHLPIASVQLAAAGGWDGGSPSAKWLLTGPLNWQKASQPSWHDSTLVYQNGEKMAS